MAALSDFLETLHVFLLLYKSCKFDFCSVIFDGGTAILDLEFLYTRVVSLISHGCLTRLSQRRVGYGVLCGRLCVWWVVLLPTLAARRFVVRRAR